MSNDKSKSCQVQQRPTKLTVPCDKLSKIIFTISRDEYAGIIENHEVCYCSEGVKKGEKVETPFWLKHVKDYKDKLPPDGFTRAVLFHAMNFLERGFKFFTFSMVFDSLNGGEEKRHICKEQYDAIKRAIDNLGFTLITIDLKPLLEACPKYAANFKGDLKRAEIVGCLLPMKYAEIEINGQKTLAVKLLDESPLMTYAKLKNQVMTYDISPLAIPGQKNTPQVMTIKNYLLRRIELARQRKGIRPIILFDTLYKNCGLADASDSTKQNARKIIVDTLKAFVSDGVIKNFEFERQDGTYRAIKFYF